MSDDLAYDMQMFEPSFGDKSDATLSSLPNPILWVGLHGDIIDATPAAESFFEMSRALMRRRTLGDLCGSHSPLTHLYENARANAATYNEYAVELAPSRGAPERLVDIFIGPLGTPPEKYVIMLQERTIADKMSRQLTHRGAARSIATLSAMLAHEIKNPLSGISGAAQLLEGSVSAEDRGLTRLIREETDRIVRLVDRFEMFSDGRPLIMEPINIHSVLDHVKAIALSGFARGLRIRESYDPSLPPVMGNRDQLIQVFLNLVKNATEAIENNRTDGEINLTTAYRPGVRMAVAGSRNRVSLPLEVCVRDNGPGVPAELLPLLFDPFVTTKTNGSGLGLALVAKVIGVHGGIVECESVPNKTIFRVLLPTVTGHEALSGDA